MLLGTTVAVYGTSARSPRAPTANRAKVNKWRDASPSKESNGLASRRKFKVWFRQRIFSHQILFQYSYRTILL